jgi:hypothetical protein
LKKKIVLSPATNLLCLFGFMSDVTLILQAVRRGDGQAAEELLPMVYNELRRLAAARMA